MNRPLRVTMVCTGNICRSPIAEVVVRDAVERAGLEDLVVVDSAGIGAWHVGEGADPRTVRVLADHGYDGAAHRAQQVTRDWFARGGVGAADGAGDGAGGGAPDVLVAMDAGHHDALVRLAPGAEVVMLRSFSPGLGDLAPGDQRLDVPDPYYGDRDGFVTVLEMIEAATPGLLAHLTSRLGR
jgi:protein-tyrosine phosphatase